MMLRTTPLALLLILSGCSRDQAPKPIDYPAVIAGAPVVGAAEGWLELPMGTPLSGFTSRCSCMGGSSRVDDRQSNYNVGFVESVGVQTYPSIKVIWLENGDDDLVWIKTDNIYSADNLVVDFTAALQAATGRDLQGKVVHSANHTHSSFGDFFRGVTFYLGSDRYNQEIAERFVQQVVSVALEAYDTRQPAKIGIGWATDWDPDDLVYNDRRPENDELKVWDDLPAGYGKDPHLAVMRFDTLDDQPIAMTMTFGMHGTAMGGDSPMVSSDSGGHVEQVVAEQFDSPVVVMFTQGSGGDAAPGGSQGSYARLESIGDNAADAVLQLWSDTPTSADPIRLQTAERHLPQSLDQITVTRDGTVDWSYAPPAEGESPDNQVYDADGSLLSPIDEFNAPNGAVFCGSGELDLPVGGIGGEVFPYNNCVDIELMSRLLLVFFDLEESDVTMPLPESLRAATIGSRMGPIATLLPDGQELSQELLVGWFPGETTAMFAEQYRRRVAAELGFNQPLMVGYSNDHEGYLLIPEDWLVGGYEPDISIWGPLGGEYIMEGNLALAKEVLSGDVHTDPDPWKRYTGSVYPELPLPTLAPDLTPDAGTLLDALPEEVWLPESITADLVVPAEVSRVSGQVQLAWLGGDPGVDSPRVVLERKQAGAWVEVTSHAGRPITEAMPDILLVHTPQPLYPVSAQQQHVWWAVWQAVGHVRDRAALPTGSYRLKVDGRSYAGGSDTWPWASTPYSVSSEPFELAPAALELAPEEGGAWVSITAPSWGYRMVARGGAQNGANPVVGPITVDDGVGVQMVEVDAPVGGRTWVRYSVDPSASGVTITDAAGNSGSYTL